MKTMKCNYTDKKELIDFLKTELIYNSFSIADIEIYGFDKPYQDVYKSVNKFGKIESVYLVFHNNLILSGSNVDLNFIETLLNKEITSIMGKDEIVKSVREVHNNDFLYSSNYMYSLNNDKKLLPANNEIELTTLKDVDEIYDFLQSIEEFKTKYKSKDMIKNRILSGEGVHLVLRKEGKIIAHANSAAESEFTTMIGGVATAKKFRNNNLAKELVSTLSKQIISEGRIPCAISEKQSSESFFTEIGFFEVGKWGTLEKRK